MYHIKNTEHNSILRQISTGLAAAAAAVAAAMMASTKTSSVSSNRTYSYWTILFSFVFFLISTTTMTNTSWYVKAETQNSRGGGDNKHQGIQKFVTYRRERKSLSSEKKEQGEEDKMLIVNRGRDLLELPPALQRKGSGSNTIQNENGNRDNDKNTAIKDNKYSNENQERFDVSQPPNEINVSTPPSSSTVTLPPVDDQIIEPLDYRDPINTGNPRIRETLPFNFEIGMLVQQDSYTNDLLQNVEKVLEEYIEMEYQKLVDGAASETLRLEQVDLTLYLVDSKWWEERNRRHLDLDLLKGPLRSRQRNLQEQQQQSNIKLMAIDVVGSVYYSMDVDGSIPTPDNVQEQFSAAYIDIVSQNQLQQAIADAGIEGVLRLEQVTINNDLNGNTEVAPENSDAGDNISNLYKDDNDNINTNIEDSNPVMVENSIESSTSDKSSQLERPSTLSIVFGFVLTAIAIIGLVAYAYIFYRKRQKSLRKKRKMQETITFPSAAAAISKTNHNMPTRSIPQSSPIPATRSSNKMHANPMILSRADTSYSEDTSYKGIESSIGSEDISDSFAGELQLAASLDQQAWDEFQRKKAALDRGEINGASGLRAPNRMLNKNLKTSARASVPSLLSKDLISSREEEDEAIETNLEGTASFGKSFPYGDEENTSGGGGYDEVDKFPSSASPIRQEPESWEPYHSALLQPSNLGAWEEKKDETSPSDFFAQKLQDIENDLSESAGQPVDISRRSTEALTTDDSATSDILSEVSELSRYVRRYERRKDRKSKRDVHQQERHSIVGGIDTYSSPAPNNTMSIGMDGRVYKPQSSNNYAGVTNFSSPIESPPYSPGLEEFVSDDDESNAEEIEGSQRLGISPYRTSNYTEPSYYKNPSVRDEENSSPNRTQSSRTRSTRPQEDYRYSVGYGQDDSSHPHDKSRSSSSRLAHLRANDAIIDSSSDVNLTVPNGTLNSTSIMALSNANKGSDMARLNLGRTNKCKNTAAVVSAATSHHNDKTSTKSNYRFDKLRGLFEQRTNEQPEPIYPPGENWQNAGSLGNKNKN